MTVDADESVDAGYTLDKPEGLLAHYTTAEVAFEHVLPEGGQLQLSRYADMNDPVEAQDLRIAFSYGDRSDEEANATYDAALQVVEEIRGSRRLFCLTRDTPDTNDTFGCCWARPRMWDRYGDRHRGACLVFDRGKLRMAFHEQMPTPTRPGEPTLHMGHVRYTPGGIADSEAVGSIVGDEAMFSDTRAAVARHIDAHYADFYLLKSDDWESEYEYRMLLASDTGEPYAKVDYRDALVAVVVGYRFPLFQLAGAQLLCDQREVQLRRMWWEGGTPSALRTRRPNE
jgi:hypothetical protein